MLARLDPVPIGRPSFLGAPRPVIDDLRPGDVAVVGIAYTTPADLQQATSPSLPAPGTVRQQSLRLAEVREGRHDFEFGGDLFAGRPVGVVDCGDAPALPGRFAQNGRLAATAVEAVLARGGLPLVLGGDHAAALPALRACAGLGPLAVVHLGATLDWREQVHGIFESAGSTMRRAAELAGVTGMLQVGLRGGGTRAAEVAAAAAFGSQVVRAEEVHERGVAAALARLPVAPAYYLSLDMPALDPAIAPGVETPAFGGLTYFEVTNLLKGIAARGPVVGASLSGIVPGHDHHDLTSLLGARLLLNLLGALAHAGRLDPPSVRRPDRRAADPVTLR
jgi:agmatinase